GDCSARFVALNHGKDVVEIDIKSGAGQRAVLDLARTSDVFVHNWAPGKAAELRLDADDLHGVNPRLVYAYASGWGAALSAGAPPGVDFMVQAYAGLGELVGGPGAPRPSLMTLLDVLGAHVCVAGILAALVDRQRSGHGHRVDSSLLGAADLLLAEELAAAGAPSQGPRPGALLLARVFDTADEPLAVAVRSATTLAALCRFLGMPVPEVSDPVPAIESRLAPVLAGAPALTWRNTLHRAGVPAAVVRRDLVALPADPRFASRFAAHGCSVVTTPWRFS
ncbi:MAG TPA: CoA transferase, partial [Pseudonocardiaceae bacterium]|nr:CoA transferase [Pseudonocardiaceae bacterium]